MRKRIGRYQIDREMDPVAGSPTYLAFDRDTGLNVLLERIPDDGSDRTAREYAREINRRKAEQAAALRHERIAQTYGVIDENDGLWVAREPVKGETLENLLCTEAAISKDLISMVLYQTAGCLDYAHRLGACHGRLSPAEIVFLDDGTLKVVGFWRPSLASSGAVSAFDSTHYSAPEQIRGLPPQPASDQYSLASIVYELLTGVTPFQGDAIAVRNRIVLDAPTDPSQFNPSLGPDAATVLLRALTKSQQDRFGGCVSFVEALDQALETPPLWRLPEAYQGHAMIPSPAGEGAQLQGEVTEALLREVLREQPVPRKGLQAVSKRFKVAGLGALGAIAALVALTWALSSSPEALAVADLTVPAASPPPAVSGQPYSYSLQASGGRSPYEWSVVEGQLPEGLTLEPQGTIRGQSSAMGVFEVRVQVQGAGAEPAIASQLLNLTVKQGPRIKSSEVLPPALVGRDYASPLGVEGGQRPYRWAVASGAIPPGLSLNAFSGFIGGRPQAAGTYRFSISVSDLFAATSTRGFELTVAGPAEGEAVQRESIERVARAAGAVASAE